jgi:hypothetical protein
MEAYPSIACHYLKIKFLKSEATVAYGDPVMVL